MSKYDFDTPINRSGTNSLKWDIKDGELPMWVADMDFAAAPEIIKAVVDRARHGVYGYSVVPDEWYDAYINRWKDTHGLIMDKGGLIFCTGVIPAISSIIRRLTHPAENVVILTPVYNIFYNCILNNGRRVLECELIYKDGEYSIDFAALKRALSLPQTAMLLLCNPHNPIGKIWDKDTLCAIGSLCKKYGVIAVSDEIHCDVTDPDKEYQPFACASEDCRDVSITCISPTKAFNLAGIQTAAVYIPDRKIKNRVERGLNNDEIAEPNAFAVQAAVAAFTKGGEWLSELRRYLYENKRLAAEVIDAIPDVSLVRGAATYLLWIDCTKLARGGSRGLAEHIREKTGLYLSAGEEYGKGGESFLRLNIACPRSVLIDGLDRLKKGIELYR